MKEEEQYGADSAYRVGLVFHRSFSFLLSVREFFFFLSFFLFPPPLVFPCFLLVFLFACVSWLDYFCLFVCLFVCVFVFIVSHVIVLCVVH